MKPCTLSLEIPNGDEAATFSRMPLSAQQQYLAWKHALTEVALGTGRLEDRLRAAGLKMGCSYQTARRKWDCAKRCGWRALIDERKIMRAAESTVPAAFWEFWRGLCEKNNRSCRQAYQQIIALWNAGSLLPGYDVNPPSDVTGFPMGLSYSNCMRHAPTKYELKAMRIGAFAAKSEGDLVLRTRVGLEVGKVYMFDDQWHDDTVIFEGPNTPRQTVRALEMMTLDVASGCKIKYGLRPRLKNMDTGKHQQLCERDMKLLVVATLLNFGYRPDGTLLIVEGGTATIRRDDFERALDTVTGGAVRVVRGKCGVAPVVLGGWPGPAKGNFRLKASLESLHGLDHNALGLIPGQTGSNSRENRPEKLTAIERYTANVLKQVDALPADRAQEIMAKLRFELMQWQEYSGVVDMVYRWISHRTEHDLEGWIENGWTAQEWRQSPDQGHWLPAAMLDKMDPEKRELMLAQISAPGCKRIRRLSPMEVAQAGKKHLVRLRPEHVPVLLGHELAEAKSIDSNGCVKFSAQEYGGGNPLVFPVRRLKNVLGQEVVYPHQDTCLCFPNPFDTTRLLVCDHDGSFFGVAERQIGIKHSDLDAIHKAIGKADHGRAVMDAPLRARHSAEADEKMEMQYHNAEVLAHITGGTAGGKARRISNADDANMAAISAPADPDDHVEDDGDQVTRLDDLI